MAKIGRADEISPIFEGILARPMQANPHGPSETKSFKTAAGKPIQHWIMLVPMPSETTYSQYIPHFLREFQALYQMDVIKSAYKCCVNAYTQNAQMLS